MAHVLFANFCHLAVVETTHCSALIVREFAILDRLTLPPRARLFWEYVLALVLMMLYTLSSLSVIHHPSRHRLHRRHHRRRRHRRLLQFLLPPLKRKRTPRLLVY